METEPTPADKHLMEIYRKLPDVTLEAEETRIRAALAELSGRLLVITQVRGTGDEHTISA